MGLRINNNPSIIRVLRNIEKNNRNLENTLERLSTGKKVNTASDDPSGFALSERIRSQIRSMEKAASNIQDGSNMISTADTALQNVTDQLQNIQQSITFALNNGSASEDQIAAEQDAVDSAVSAIERIARTTKFNGTPLLDGTNDFVVPSTTGSAINDLDINRMDFPTGASSRRLELSLVQSAQRGALQIGSATTEAKIRVFGPRGTKDINVASGDENDVREAINNVAGETGIFASAAGSAGSSLALTEEFGEDEMVKLEVLEGNVEIQGSGRSKGFATSDNGLNPEVKFNGTTVEGQGREFRIMSNFVDFQFHLNPAGSTVSISPSQFSGDQAFRVNNSGLNIQTGGDFGNSDSLRLGFRSTSPEQIGVEEVQDAIGRALGDAGAEKGGFLQSITSGEDSSLFENPENAKKIVDQALEKVGQFRSFIGSTKSGVLDNRRDLSEKLNEKLESSRSQIVDADMAEESANLSRQQVIQQAGISVLAQANTLPGQALQLLQS